MGSIVYQVQEIWNKSGINQIGKSKHVAKEEARQALKSSGQQADWHAVGKKMGIHSLATAKAYRNVWILTGKFAKAEFGVKYLEKLTGEHIRAFLELKATEGVAHATLMLYAAALEKLEVALTWYSAQKGTARAYSFGSEIASVRTEANKTLERFEGSRAYADPKGLVEAVRGDTYGLVATIQRESGCRVKETNHIKASQLRGLHQDPRTGQTKGWIEVKGKGGKLRQVGMSPKTYGHLRNEVSGGRRFQFSASGYRAELRKAAEKTSQKYEGSHGLRWSWAQERFQELQKHRMMFEQAMFQVSNEMGHDRGDITEHYLR